ncbi:GIY-YIG nuclease family protein [Candidatus Aerophobetes bacterium]|nr:GIY-YIG nuclease family protein [Candidatus Aerophobetes bacterium]
MKGTYALLIEVKKNIDIRIGKLGRFKISKGNYIYVGSGKNNLEKRIERHLRREKRKFWHIDYLLGAPGVKVKNFWVKEREEECLLARKIASSKMFKIPVPGFGSSDCKCKAHLFLILKEGGEEEILRQSNFLKNP